MPEENYRNIEKVEGRCGGCAVVVGTRMRVSSLFGYHRQGMSVEEIVEQFPHLRPADVYAALAYAYDHQKEIEAEIADDDESAVQQRYAREGPAA